ncbi:MAG: Na(+)-translocating NADH-quinone reductase subunit C [Planctomycetales bacterium]|nr:Na(+)-translocating NADH-quinone reductase subunit C [Planctomycetales bacterium]
MQRDSIQNTLLVAFVLCVVCSVLVSGAAVGLRGIQEQNRVLDRQKNVLLAAQLLKREEATNEKVAAVYAEKIEPELIDLETGQPVSADDVEFDIAAYDQKAASKSPDLSEPIASEDDVAGIKRREKYAFVYKVKNESGDVQQLVLPIYGKGLWSTLYGFLALQADGNTVDGITYYDQKETPGLGGEVENPKWQAMWVGKTVYGTDGGVELSVIKGQVDPTGQAAEHQIDGLSGATITSKGVSNMIHFWLGPQGFGPYLEKFRDGEGGQGG